MKSEDAMYGAIVRGDTGAVSRILEEDPSVLFVFAVRKNWLHWAAQKGNVEMMSILVDAGLPICGLTSDGESTPLNFAAGQAQIEACKWLVDRGAYRNGPKGIKRDALLSAIYGNSREIVALLIANGAEVGDQRDRFVRYAEKFGTPEIVELLKHAVV